MHPSLKEQIGLKRLTKVYQWLKPGLDESDVFEMHRKNVFNLAQKPEEWMNSLPPAIRISKSSSDTPTNVFHDLAKQSKKFLESLPSMPMIPGLKVGSQEEVTASPFQEMYGRLPAIMELMESMVENDNRLTMYESEIEIILRLGMSFQEWRQLAPSSPAQGNGMNLIYLTVL